MQILIYITEFVSILSVIFITKINVIDNEKSIFIFYMTLAYLI